MQASEITRLNVESIDLNAERIELAKKAHELLGYDKLANAIVYPDALLFGLRALGIEPLSTESVNRYKASKEWKGMWSGKKWFLIGVTTMFSSLIFAIVTGVKWHTPGPTWQLAAWVTSLVMTVVGFGTAVKYVDSGKSGTRKIAGWATYSLTSKYTAMDRTTGRYFPVYEGNLPEHVLNRAVQIAEKVPNVQFSVDCLLEGTEEKAHPSRDPLLKASLAHEHYYVDVWDEEEYERQIM